MTVQRLLDRLAHVPDKTKSIMVVCGEFCRPLERVEDTKGKVLFLELEEAEDGDQ